MKAVLLSLLIAAITSCSTSTRQVSSQGLPASDSLSAEAEEGRTPTEEDPDAMMEAIRLEIEKTWSGLDETKTSEYSPAKR